MRVFSMWCLLLCFVGVGCESRNAPLAPSGEDVDLRPWPSSAEGYEAPEQEARLAELRELHGWAVSGEGSPCQSDALCLSPLRCLEGTCAFPVAMTGVADETSPAVVFRTANGDRHYFVELALQPAEHARGLMHRTLMHERFGMLFVFPADEPRSFWMQNTLIPLDMIFVRSDGVIDSIVANAEPRTETLRRSRGPARFVIELIGGEAERAGIRPGDRVRFEQIEGLR